LSPNFGDCLIIEKRFAEKRQGGENTLNFWVKRGEYQGDRQSGGQMGVPQWEKQTGVDHVYGNTEALKGGKGENIEGVCSIIQKIGRGEGGRGEWGSQKSGL